MLNDDHRLAAIKQWLSDSQGFTSFDIAPASSDASFRRYFRVIHDGRSHIVMDAPPDKENCEPFVRIGTAMHRFGLNVPRIVSQDLAQGFLLLSDLGSRQYLDELDEQSADRLYWDAIDALVKLQAAGEPGALSPYDDELLQREMALFRDWLVGDLLKIDIDIQTSFMLKQAFEILAASALKQQRVWVHRDYHSRNLMVCDLNNPGILDFQDAVYGPITYDLVSLLRDCYIAWPRQQVEAWVTQYYQRAIEAGMLNSVSRDQFIAWFDVMGIQRHLKASGIFARLNYRDHKPGYLKDIPRTLNYVLAVAPDYPPLHQFVELMQELAIASHISTQAHAPSVSSA